MVTSSTRRNRLLRLTTLTAALVVVNSYVGGVWLTQAQTPPPKTDPKGKSGVITDIHVAGGGGDQIAYINEAIEKEWVKNKLTPAARCSDNEFIRRATLDIIGRIAKPTEIERFLKDPPSERRGRLIERLLASEDYANHFANLWSNLLLTRTGNKVYHEQMHLWLFDQFSKKDSAWDQIVTDLLTATGRTNENGAVNYILAHLGEEMRENRAESGRFEMVPATSRTTRLFLGVRTQCVQCHDNRGGNDEWQQGHFWGINAFFRQVDAPKGRPMPFTKKKGVEPPQLELVDNPGFNKEAMVPYERRNAILKFTRATFLDGQKLPAKNEGRRPELARFIVRSDYFSRAFVNRMWGHFFGRSFIKEVDDFGAHNDISHPELLDKLAKDFIASKYDPRALIRWITNSKAYGLSSVANATNDKVEAEPYFSRMLLKVMTPEQLFESLVTATNSHDGQKSDSKREDRERWLNQLIVNFGDDEGSEGNFNGTVVQALLMMNGKEINKAIDKSISADKGTVVVLGRRRDLSAKSMQAAIVDLYYTALNRPPTDREFKRLLSNDVINLPRLKNQVRDAAFYSAYLRDIFWALLNSNEFILNH